MGLLKAFCGNGCMAGTICIVRCRIMSAVSLERSRLAGGCVDFKCESAVPGCAHRYPEFWIALFQRDSPHKSHPRVDVALQCTERNANIV